MRHYLCGMMRCFDTLDAEACCELGRRRAPARAYFSEMTQDPPRRKLVRHCHLECGLLRVARFVVVVALFGLARAQPTAVLPFRSSDDLESACRKATEADAADLGLIVHHRSPELDAALHSEAAFWKFLIDPSTSYMDRMAAAHLGGDRVPPGQLLRLWKAYAEFEVLPTGVNPPPCEFIGNAWGARSPSVWAMRKTVPVPGTVSGKPESRTLLGFETRLPEKAIDYPLNVADRNPTPWVWQMSRALTELERNVRQYYAHPDRYVRMTEAALQWHPDNFYERRVRTRALTQGPRNASWVRTQLKLALDEGIAAGVLNTSGDDNLHLEELIHVAHIAILQQSSDWRVAAGSAALLAEMKKKTGTTLPWFGPEPLRSATSVMAMAQWAMNASLSVEQRYTFARAILDIVDDPSFKPNPTADSKEQAGAVRNAENWLYTGQVWLEPRVAREIDGLDAVAAELGTHIQVPARIVTRWGVHPFLLAPTSPGRF